MIPEQILDAALNARTIFVMGDKDTGKTTHVLSLANELRRQGFSVGVIDADIGQSDIGPPTTVGFGIVQAPLTTLADAAVQALYFVGAISPRGCLLPLTIGTRKMLDRALAQGLQKIIIDTTGLISGQLGRVLKTCKIQLTTPDVILCLQRAGECEHILSAYRGFAAPRILRHAPTADCRLKTPSARQSHRAKLFTRYFTHARLLDCSLTELGVFEAPLFNGNALSAPHIARLNQDVRRLSAPEPAAAGSQPDLSPPALPHILWGELSGGEALLVTSHPLRYHQIMGLKTILGDIKYIKNTTPADYRHLVLGMLNHHGDCCALGILRALDFVAQQASIFTCAAPHEIAAVQFSNYIYPEN